MKKLLIVAVVVFGAIMASCGSSQGGHCDAYGSVNTIENSDLASK